uniref:Uncharacterized protein n=1 Tax=Salix viminalis TaxID=40686 RepID=A0A6N2KYU4_SALVM
MEFNLSYLEVPEKFEKVFVRLGESEPSYMSYFLENKKNIGPTSLEDWKNGRTLVKFLKIFTWLRFFGSLNVKPNSFFNEIVLRAYKFVAIV